MKGFLPNIKYTNNYRYYYACCTRDYQLSKVIHITALVGDGFVEKNYFTLAKKEKKKGFKNPAGTAM